MSEEQEREPTIDAKDIFVEDSMGQKESLHNIIWMLLSDMHEITTALNVSEETVH